MFICVVLKWIIIRIFSYYVFNNFIITYIVKAGFDLMAFPMILCIPGCHLVPPADYIYFHGNESVFIHRYIFVLVSNNI